MLNLNKDIKYLVAVSGGPDSMFLLNQVKDYQIVVCHVNYHFRDDSDFDQKVVEDFCKKHGLKLEILSISQDYQKLKQNFEEYAREARYNFFDELGQKHDISHLLVAHNLNDSVETYIIQKERKSNVNWFGLPQVSTYKNLTVVRPMLKYFKTDILEILNKEKIAYAIDSTNSDSKYLRNAIRKNLNEKDFENYVIEIKQANKILTKLKSEVEFYVNNNITADELIIKENLKEFSEEKVERIIFEFLKVLRKDYLLQKRKANTIKEITSRLKNSNKPFWTIKLSEYYIVKDYNVLFLASLDQLVFKRFTINSKEDLYLAEEFPNWLDLFNAIKKDKENYPYVITNNYLEYKKHTKVDFIKTNRYLIEQKIRYKTRFFKGVVYQLNEQQILNKFAT